MAYIRDSNGNILYDIHGFPRVDAAGTPLDNIRITGIVVGWPNDRGNRVYGAGWAANKP